MNGKVPKEMKPGTVILQYKNNSDHFLGMVAHPSKARHLSKESLMHYERFLNDPERPDLKEHVCLVLLWKGFGESDSYFAEPRVRHFPWYETGQIAVAEKVDLTPEFNLMKIHAASQSAGLVRGVSLRRDLFGFGAGQKNALVLVQLILWHVSGRPGDPYDVVRLVAEVGTYWGDWGVKFLQELETAAPLG